MRIPQASFFVFLACALSANAARRLTLDVDGPEAVTTVEDLKLTTTLTNNGDETIRVLTDPEGPLSKLPAETFTIESEAGVRPDFTGIKAKYSPKAAIAAGAYITLEPGQSINVEHDLGEAYDFTRPGAGKYTIGARNSFYVVGPNDTVEVVQANVGRKHRGRVSGKLRAARPHLELEKRATYVSCSSSQQSTLVTAASSAQSYASASNSYLQSLSSGTSRYTTWFGTYSSSNAATVRSHFSLIASRQFSSFTYDCSCTDSGTYAYVYPGTFGRIYLCGAFWRAPNTGTDSRAGTLVHESSHFTVNGGTSDHAYGQANCRALAQSNPSRAINNADSHEYFTENNPSLP